MFLELAKVSLMEVRVQNLKKYFGRIKAVDDISFTFEDGQIVGFVGPNGAGKTTTMRIMSTIEDPTEGDIHLNGVSVVLYPEKARKMVGFMPDFLPTHRDMTVGDYLDFTQITQDFFRLKFRRVFSEKIRTAADADYAQ